MPNSKASLSKITGKLALLLVCLELISSVYFLIIPFWYEEACRIVQRNPTHSIHFIFIGSSRVAIAIDTDEFVKDMGFSDRGAIQSINLGRGYSTQIEHYFGLKKLLATNPDALRGTVVFDEAPMGVPDLATWDEGWFNPENPGLLANAMTIRDLKTFYLSPNTDLETRIEMTVRKLSRTYQLFGNGISLLANVKMAFQKRGFIPKSATDLTAVGGILTDSASIAKARSDAMKYAEMAMKTQPVFSLDQSEHLVLKSINDLITANGGRLVLYKMPLCSIQQKPYTTAQSIKNQLLIRKMLSDWKIPVLEPVIQTTDADFPDSWHLRSSRSPEFSRKLAQAYLAGEAASSSALSSVVLNPVDLSIPLQTEH